MPAEDLGQGHWRGFRRAGRAVPAALRAVQSMRCAVWISLGPLPARLANKHSRGRVSRHQLRKAADRRGDSSVRAQGSRRTDQTCDVFTRKDLWQTLGPLGHRDVETGFRTTEHPPRQEAEGARRLIDARAGELLVANQVQQAGWDLLDAQIRGRSVVILRQLDQCRGRLPGSVPRVPAGTWRCSSVHAVHS